MATVPLVKQSTHFVQLGSRHARGMMHIEYRSSLGEAIRRSELPTGSLLGETSLCFETDKQSYTKKAVPLHVTKAIGGREV
jgi:hypothetical protein